MSRAASRICSDRDVADLGGQLGRVVLAPASRARRSRPRARRRSPGRSSRCATISCSSAFISITLVPGRGARCTVAARATGVRRGSTQIDLRRVRAGQPVEDAGPQHGLGLGHVVPVERDDVGVVDVGVGAGLPVAGEGLLQRRGRRGRAQPGVAVDVVGADAAVRDQAERVVLLEEQLAGRVEADRARALLVEQLPVRARRRRPSRCPSRSRRARRRGGSAAG